MAASKSPPMVFVSGSPTRQRYFHVISCPFLFHFPDLLGQGELKKVNNDSMILKFFTSKNCHHDRKEGPTFNIHPNVVKESNESKWRKMISNFKSISSPTFGTSIGRTCSNSNLCFAQKSRKQFIIENCIFDSPHVCSDKLRFPTWLPTRPQW